MKPSRPVFRDPWDSPLDIFSSYVAVSIVDPLLLFAGGELTSAIFGFDSHWRLGVYMAAAVVGAAGYITIVGRARSSLSVDVLAIAVWVLLGLLVAPIVGLALPTGVALACYGLLLVGILVFVRRFGRWETDFVRSLSWPLTWTLIAVFFAYCAYELLLYP